MSLSRGSLNSSPSNNIHKKWGAWNYLRYADLSKFEMSWHRSLHVWTPRSDRSSTVGLALELNCTLETIRGRRYVQGLFTRVPLRGCEDTNMNRWALLTPVIGATLFLASCGSGNQDCAAHIFASITVSPPNATADHSAAPPANSQQFTASEMLGSDSSACPVPTTAQDVTNIVTWSVSPVTQDVTVSNGNGTNGLATCVGPTNPPTSSVGVVATDSRYGRVTCPTCPQGPAQADTILTCK